MEFVEVYTDGGCRGNGKDEEAIGSFGIYMNFRGKTKKLCKAEQSTTNQRMELEACATALEMIHSDAYPVRIYSDSAYLINCMNQKWYKKWIMNGWKTSNKEPVKNKDLWERIINNIDGRFYQTEFVKVKGHSTNEGNNVADWLCNYAMDNEIFNLEEVKE